MIHDEIVTHEVAKLAKGKGFDWECPMFYNPEGKLKYGWAYDPMNSGLDMRDMLCHNSRLPLGFGAECSAPTQSLLQRWLREEKGIHIIIDGGFQWGLEDLQRHFIDRDIQVNIGAFGLFDTYEEALHDALLYALQNV